MTLNLDEQTRGPECIDEPGATHKTYFAQWSWKPWDGGRIGWVNFKMWRVNTWEMDGTPIFSNDTCIGDDDRKESKDPTEIDPFMRGFRKWDGCTQWDWSSNMHEDSAEELEELFRAVRKTHEIAAEIMGETWDGCGSKK
jgi:hypothetical protein